MRNFQRRLTTKTADMDLGTSPDQWDDKILKRIYRRHPYLTDYLQGSIDWSVEPIDASAGDGVGMVIARINDQPIRIPIVVRDRELQPVDLYLKPNGEMDLLDEGILQEHPEPQPAEVGQKVMPPRARLYNGGIGVDNLMNKVSSYQGFDDDVARMRRHHEGMSEVFDRLEKRASSTTADTSWDALVASYRERPVQSDQIKIAGYHRGTPAFEESVSRHEAFDDPDSGLADLARLAKKRGEAVVTRRSPNKEAMVVDSAGSGELVDVDPGDRMAIPVEGGEVKGRVYPLVALSNPYPDGDEAELGQAVLTEDQTYMYPVSLPARKIREGSAPSSVGVAKSLYDVSGGEKGFLVIPQGGDRLPALSGPMTAQQWRTTPSGEEVLVVRSRLGGTRYIVPSDVLPQIQEVEREEVSTGNNRFLVPENVKFLPTMGEIEPGTAEKEASSGSSYRLKQDGQRIRVGSRGTYAPSEAKAVLLSLGAGEKTAQTAIDRTQSERGDVTVKGLDEPTRARRGDEPGHDPSSEKVANVLEKWAVGREKINRLVRQLPQALQNARKPRPQNMMPSQPRRSRTEQKLQGSATEQTEEIQDSLGAVNLLSQYNASKFAESLDEIEQAKEVVSELLYRTRTGAIETLEADIVKDALVALDAVTEGLRELRATQQANRR